MTSLFNSANKNNSSSSSDNGSREKSYVDRQVVKSALQSLAKDLGKIDSEEKNHFREKIAQIIKLTAAVDQQERLEKQTLWAIAEKLRLAENNVTLLNTTVKEVDQLLNTERVLLYAFSSDSKGIVVAEVVREGFTPTIGEELPSLCFGLSNAQSYQRSRVSAIANVRQADLSPYQLQLMERFQVSSSLAVPVLLPGKVWGLMVVQQCLKPRRWQDSELRLLERISTELAVQSQIEEVRVQLQGKLKAENALAKVIEKLRQPFDLEVVYKTATLEVRKLLEIERVCIYKFRSDYFGDFVAEAELAGFPRLVGSGWEDSYLQENQGGRFRKNEAFVCDDINHADLSDCHIEALQEFGIKSCAVVAIFQGQKLWGLLSAFQSTSMRHWSESEVQLLKRVAAQIGIGLQQTASFEQVRAKNTQLAKIAEREKSLTRIIENLRQALNVQTSFRRTTQDLRSLLNCDRVAIYQFNPDFSGRFVAESFARGWESLMENQDKIPNLQESVSDCQGIKSMTKNSLKFSSDTFLQETQGGNFNDRQLLIREDIYQAGLTPCYIEVLEEYQAKAYAIAPIFLGEKLWGLLAAFHNSEPRHWETGELNALSQVGTQLGVALQQGQFVEKLQEQSEQISKLADQVIASARIIYELGQQSPTQLLDSDFLKSFLRLSVVEARRLFDTDRVTIYEFNSDWSGQFVVEDLGKEWKPLIGTPIEGVKDTYLEKTQGGRYAKNESLRVDNIYTQGYESCHIQILEKFEAKAYMLAPIFKGEQLWGLLAAYHNSEPRNWSENELRLLTQVAAQLGVVIQRAEYLQQLNLQQQQLAEAAEREKTDKERLQRETLSLLRTIEPSLQGDLTVKVPLWEDEVGTIADAYNTTLQTLRELVKQVKSSAEKVDQTCSNSKLAVGQLSYQAQKQSQDLRQALKELQQMVELIAQVAVNAQQVDKAVLDANRTVQAGDSVMKETVAGIAEIRETVAETAKKLKNLGESSQKIAKVVNLIDNFANQTNLLAINAAIEATRAGEYGRGFAVVADEIRTLAYQSANAGTEIERLVQEIRTETQSVTEAMELGIMQVVKGTELVNKTRQSLDEISSATNQISDRVQQITASTSTQTEQSQLMTKAMTDVADIAHKTSSNSVNIASLFEELLVTSEQLQTSVSKFKID